MGVMTTPADAREAQRAMRTATAFIFFALFGGGRSSTAVSYRRKKVFVSNRNVADQPQKNKKKRDFWTFMRIESKKMEKEKITCTANCSCSGTAKTKE